MTDTRREEIAVKPLEWEWFDAWTWWAETVVGKYRVEERGKQWAWTLNEADSYTHGENEESEFAAKAAAQADYERRILSALTPAPEAGWRDMDSAPKDGTRFLAYEKSGDYCISECWWEHDWQEWSGWQNDWDSEPNPTHWMPLPPAPGTQPATEQRLARNQPCGCIVCHCEDDEQCQGCGAKSCGNHPVGEIPNPVFEQPATEQPDDVAVNRFAEAMKAKMSAAREKGRSGWDDPEQCSLEFLASLLIGHVRKGNAGNFEDIANLCMMLHQRGADPSILAATEQQSVKEAGLLKRLAAHLALNAHMNDATSDAAIAHNVGVDSAIAEILKIARGEAALRSLAGDE